MVDTTWRLFLCVGLLGGFTTFSSFGYEAITMLTQGKTMMAGMYAGCSVVAGLFAAITGMMVTKFIL
jgi:CrcB protein